MRGIAPARARRTGLRACALLLALAAAWVLAAGSAHAAEGDAGGEAVDGNAVNTQQLPDSSFIYDTSIVDLSKADAYYDNQTVQVVGEVVGDSIRANVSGNHRWITLASDGGTATIAVYMSSESASKIDLYGKYGTTGTALQVRGTFHLVCPDHDGASDLHAETVSVVDFGSRHADEFDLGKFVPGIVAVALGFVLTALFYWVRERRR